MRGKRWFVLLVGMVAALEGFVGIPYKDLGGVWTDGYGNTHDVRPGVAVSEPAARERLAQHLEVFAAGVQRCTNPPHTDGQMIAYTSLAYNIGLGKAGVADGFCELKRGGPSTLVRRHNAGDYTGACLAILAWDKVNKKPVRGLALRRKKEYDQCIESLPASYWRS